MKAESNIKPVNKFDINIRGNDKIIVVFFDNIQEIQRDEEILYSYDVYTLEKAYRENFAEQIESNFEKYLQEAKEMSYNKAAEEVRAKRDKLLLESDKYMSIDRLSFQIPKEITATILLSIVKDFFNVLRKMKEGDWAKYRQKLRDITEQKGFPYDVEFPQKPQSK